MKKISIILMAFVFIFSSKVKADEGMWLLTMLGKNYEDMKKQGFKLTPEDIYSLNKASLKDAIIVFGGGCTGEIISDKGLILTNHHCGYGYIQQHSTVEHDYLKDGFWAEKMKDEIPTPGATVKFLKNIKDVTADVLKGVNDKMTEDERKKAIKVVADALKKEANPKDEFLVQVKPFFGGNQYFMLVYEVFTDIRMVGTPPSSIGKYGGDTDNWMWPRHTGDFSLFRVYAGKDNKPAEFSKKNKPYQPAKHLPVSLKGVKPGDFAMIMGNPGSTDRYATSWEVKNTMEVTNANRAKIRGIRQGILKEDMLADAAIRIKYASKFARSANYWKYSIEQNKSLKQLDVMGKKKKVEADFSVWVNKSADRKQKYGETLTMIEKATQNLAEYDKVRLYLIETLIRGTEILSPAYSATRLFKEGKDGQVSVDPNAVEGMRKYYKKFYKDYSVSTDRKVAYAMFELFKNDIDPKYHPAVFENIKNNLGGDSKKWVDLMYDKSIFASEASANKFLDNPNREELMKDPAVLAATAIYGKYFELKSATKTFDQMLSKGRRLFQDAYMQIYTDKPIYPDANFTMRMTYGKVGGYNPRDAVSYSFMTTLAGVMQKEDPTNPEFVVHPKLKELYENKDYGQYGISCQKDGKVKLPTCFLTNHDITGGNSGSPVIDGEGNLIGLAFDGNSEAMSGDILFDKNLQRTINVDIRYVLFVIDKFAGAKRLIKEMDLVK
jgi:hypothetical protein